MTTIPSTFPSDKRKPAIATEFDFLSGAAGLAPVSRSMLVVGVHGTLGSGILADTPYQMFRETDGDDAFEAGSEVALMVRAAFRQARLTGVSPQIWAAGVAAPAGVPATGAFTVTGAATEPGQLEFEIAGRQFSAPISLNDTPTLAAISMDNEITKRLFDLPGTVAPAAGVLTYTHNHAGVNGNDVVIRVLNVPKGLSVATSALRAAGGTGNATIATALDNSLSRRFKMVAIANNEAADGTALATHMDDAWGFTAKNWRHAYMGETSDGTSVSTTLATGINRHEIGVASFPRCGNPPGELASVVCALILSTDAPNRNFDDDELSLTPPPAGDVLIDSEQEALLDNGVTPLVTNETGALGSMVRLITTKVTEGGNPIPQDLLLDMTDSRTMAELAEQSDIALTLAKKGRGLSDVTLELLRTALFSVAKDAEQAGWVEGVDDIADQLLVERDPTVLTRVRASIPWNIIRPLHQVAVLHVMVS